MRDSQEKEQGRKAEFVRNKGNDKKLSKWTPAESIDKSIVALSLSYIIVCISKRSSDVHSSFSKLESVNSWKAPLFLVWAKNM